LDLLSEKLNPVISESEQLKKYSKSSDWLEKSRPSKKATFVTIMLTGYMSCQENFIPPPLIGQFQSDNQKIKEI